MLYVAHPAAGPRLRPSWNCNRTKGLALANSAFFTYKQQSVDLS